MNRQRWAVRMKGFTLVELMVGMVLGLLLAIALMGVFLSSSRNTGELAKTSELLDGMRVIQRISQFDLAHAGFWVEHIPEFDNLNVDTAPADVPASIPDPCLEYSVANWTVAHQQALVGIGVQVSEDVPGTCASVLPNKLANTDVLVVRYAETCVAGTANCSAVTSTVVYFTPTRCGTQTTSYVLGTSGHSAMLERDCTTARTELRKFISRMYYVRDYAQTAGDGIPTLMVSSFESVGSSTNHQAPVALVEGIQMFKVELGIDSLSSTAEAVSLSAAISWQNTVTPTVARNRGNGTPDVYKRCTTATPCSAAELANAVAAKVTLMARTTEASITHTDSKTYTIAGESLGPFGDRFKRHVFAQTVRLNNPSSRRGGT